MLVEKHLSNRFIHDIEFLRLNWAYGLAVMTSPSHGGGRRFKSG